MTHADHHAEVVAAIAARPYGHWTPEGVMDLTGARKATACQTLVDLARDGHLAGAYGLYDAPMPEALRRLLGIPPGPRPFDIMARAASWLRALGHRV